MSDRNPATGGDESVVIEAFYHACRGRRVPRAAVLAWPELGERLTDLVYGGQIDQLRSAIERLPLQRRAQLLSELPGIAAFSDAAEPAILTVGAANAEKILKLPENFEMGGKHLVDVDELLGGGGVNHALRLLQGGFDVFPILPLGNDIIGEQIRARLVSTAMAGRASARVNKFCAPELLHDFFDPYIETPTSTVLVENGHRTVLAQALRHGERFIEHLQTRARHLDTLLPNGPKAVMISHLQSDGQHLNPEHPGSCTRFILERFGTQAITLVNFGMSQLQLGFDFWKRQGVFRHIDVLQFNLREAKLFFSDNLDARRPLPSIVDTLRREHLTAIITLDRFGALGVHRALTDSVIIAWPAVEGFDVKDPTGAGDAFAAGVMSYLCEHDRVTPGAFQSAIEIGRIWAGRACSSMGAVGECPSQVDLREFTRSLEIDRRRATEVRIPHHAREIISLLDIAFQ